MASHQQESGSRGTFRCEKGLNFREMRNSLYFSPIITCDTLRRP